MARIIFMAVMIWLALTASATSVDTSEKIFSPRFKTLKTQVDGNFDAPPMIRLGSNDRIVISFDEIGEDNSWLQWRLVHCNSDWQPSALLESEYIDGFNAVDIEDYAYSSATFVHYVNYRIVVPDEQTCILHSGNYLLQVYDRDDPDTVILQTRFQVSENEAEIAGYYNARTDRGYNDRYQQLDITATVDLGDRANPYTDFRLELLQNNREVTRRIIPVPVRVNGNKLIYDHVPMLIYPASNEYLRFESVSNNFPGMKVDSLHYMGSNFHVWLKPDAPRAHREYQYDSTQHGRYIVREYNSTDSDIGADYITVHFMLEAPEEDCDIYIDGEFTHGEFTSANRMEYDRTHGAYTLQIPLKQGAYNYQYLKRCGEDGVLENYDGDKWETQNQYTVNLWRRSPGDRADRLVGSVLIME